MADDALATALGGIMKSAGKLLNKASQKAPIGGKEKIGSGLTLMSFGLSGYRLIPGADKVVRFGIATFAMIWAAIGFILAVQGQSSDLKWFVFLPLAGVAWAYASATFLGVAVDLASP